jgi:hypothetical protein
MIELIVLGSIQIIVWGGIGTFKLVKRIRRRNSPRVNICSETPRRINRNEPLPEYLPPPPKYTDIIIDNPPPYF